MSEQQNATPGSSSIVELGQDELEMVSGGWIEVVQGPDGYPGCAVGHPGPNPRVHAAE